MATISPKKRPLEVPQQKKRRPGKVKVFVLNFYTLCTVLILFIAGTCLLYLETFNDIASQGVIINEIEQRRSKLIIENEVWNMRIAKLKSMDVIEQQDVVYRMPIVDPAEIEFIDLDRRAKEEAEEEK